MFSISCRSSVVVRIITGMCLVRASLFRRASTSTPGHPGRLGVEDDEEGWGRVAGPLCLPRSQQVVSAACPSPKRTRGGGSAPVELRSINRAWPGSSSPHHERRGLVF